MRQSRRVSCAQERDKLIGPASADFIMASDAYSHKNRPDTWLHPTVQNHKLKHFQIKWTSVDRPEMRKIKTLKRRCDSI